MKPPILPVALLSIGLSVAAQFALKAGMSTPAARQAIADLSGARMLLGVLSQPFVVLGFTLYLLGALAWLSVLAKWDVSKAYPLVGLGFAATALIGLMAGEDVGLQRAAGIALICLGVFFVSRS